MRIAKKLSVWHFGYPTRGRRARRQTACFPLERMRELAAAGVHRRNWSIRRSVSWAEFIRRAKFRDELAPQIVDELKRAPRRRFSSSCPLDPYAISPLGLIARAVEEAGNPHALNDFSDRHHAVGQAATRRVS